MQILAVVVFVALIIAAIFARKNPEDYGLKPFGEMPNKAGAAPERSWTVKEAFKTFPVWGTIIAFLTSMLAEFLIWSQVVNYFVQDIGLNLGTATNLYIVIGISGIFTMPLLGVVADKMVVKYGNEAKGRKVMLIFGPAIGVIACVLLMLTKTHIFFGIIACVLFAIYWAVEPGGCAGYAGAIYGRKSIGKIWGLATLVVMGIGPAVGTFMGGFFYDNNGSYLGSIIFALCSFAISIGFACLLPLTAEKKTLQSNKEDVATSMQA
jgi:MFS family permease